MTGRFFNVSNIEGVSGVGSSVSEGIPAMGRLFTMFETSAIDVASNSSSSWELPMLSSMASRTRRIVQICRSHTPPKCDAWGGFNFHTHSCSLRYFSTLSRFASSDFAPTKLVPQSHLIRAAGPRIARKRRRAHIKSNLI